MAERRVELLAVEGVGAVGPGDELGALIADRAELRTGDVVVVSQKVVSKVEGRVRRLDGVEPGPEARRLARETGRDPALVELILAESVRIVRATEAALIVETRSGLVCANAGIDSSNVGAEGSVTLLPADPDAAAEQLRSALGEAAGGPVGVVIADSFGRPWRLGQAEVAIGCAGLEPLADWSGRADLEGRPLVATAIATADQLAAAADLVRDKASATPAVIVRGLESLVVDRPGPGARALQRAPEQDLFR